jgi:membrane dipeptidase
MTDVPVLDGHNDLPWALRELCDGDLSRVDLAAGEPRLHTDLPRLRRGGVAAQFWSVYVPCSYVGDAAVVATLQQIDLVHRLVATYPDALTLCRTAGEVESAMRAGRVASLLGMEGGHCVNGSLAVLRAMQLLGARYLTLTHNDNLPWADSATDAPVLNGLDDFGRDVVRELNRIGMFVDLSHVSADVMRDALPTTAAPVLFSHSSARALCDHPRNVPDDVLAGLAGNGGVVMVTFVPRFVSQAWADWDRDDVPGEERPPAPPLPTVDEVADHVDHVREVAGVRHVGLGGDYDGTSRLPAGLQDVSGYPLLFEELRARGWSEQDLRALGSGNVLRAMHDVEAVASR